MKNFNTKIKGGISLIGILVLGFVLVLVLSYYKISIRSVVESPEAKDNIGYVQVQSVSVWDKYLKMPFNYLWNDIFVNILWKSFVNNMERVRDGQPTDFEKVAPRVNIGN